MGVSGSAVILTAFGNVSCRHNGLAAAFYASGHSGFLVVRLSFYLHRRSLPMSFCDQDYESVKIRSIRLIRVRFLLVNDFYTHPPADNPSLLSPLYVL